MYDTSVIIQGFAAGLFVWAFVYLINRVWLTVKNFLSF